MKKSINKIFILIISLVGSFSLHASHGNENNTINQSLVAVDAAMFLLNSPILSLDSSAQKALVEAEKQARRDRLDAALAKDKSIAGIVDRTPRSRSNSFTDEVAQAVANAQNEV